MSTYWAYKFRATLKPELRSLDIDGIRALAFDRFRGVHLQADGEPWPSVYEPVMGPDTSYDGARFHGLRGVSTEAGELRLYVSADNLEREPIEGKDGLTPGASGTRLDLLLGFLTWATVGPPGEVVGCIADEHAPDHADPMVRCADGRIRIARTRPARQGGGWVLEEPAVAEIPELLPCDLIRVDGDSHATLDCRALRERYLPLDGVLTPTMFDAGPDRRET